ncbi:uncharacterized protein CDAR_621791 [Caerostris darwini]|uniref:Uncharacterized protein n=1 Tax=Caerostris darwini TaxID=1538125 RepID=A0AAV4P830_9ARAC|nr:uncharacterized protein CDAR_621791 [Caerostris darwini]
MCPSALQFVNCIIEEAETCLGKTVEEMERSPVPTFGKILSGGRSLAQDMCDENSQFRQDYLENRQCFRGFIMAGSRLCRKEGVNIADIIMGPSDDKDEDEDEETRECLIGTYEVSCLIMELEDTCGETAQKMFVDVMSRLKGMSLSICDNKDTAAAIRSKLFDYMELEGGVRSKLDIALNRLIKRR